MEAILRTGRRVGGDASGVVIGNHDNDARTGDDEVQSDRLQDLLVPVIKCGKNIHVPGLDKTN